MVGFCVSCILGSKEYPGVVPRVQPMSSHLVTRAHVKFVFLLLCDWSGAFLFFYTGQALVTRFAVYHTLAGWLLTIIYITSSLISMMMIWWWKKGDLYERDACEQSYCCSMPRRLTILRAGSWQEFWFDDNFFGIIFGQVLAKIWHEGGSCTVAIPPFLELGRCCFLDGRPGFAQKKCRLLF